MPTSERKNRNGFVVAGLGKMGIMHAAMLGAAPGGLVAGLVDQDAKICETVRSMGVDAPAFTDLDACLNQVRPEGVWLATPQFTHRSLFEACLTRGIPVFCEAPLAHTLEDARAMRVMARRHPEIAVGVGYQLLHSPLVDKAAELLTGGALGEVRTFKASCRLSQVFAARKGWAANREQSGGGVVIGAGRHVLSLLARLFGRPSAVRVRGGGIHGEVEDAAAGLIEFGAGLWGSFEANWSVPGHEFQSNDLEVTGSAGALELSNHYLRLWLHKAHGGHPAGWSQWARGDLEPRAAFTLSPEYCGDEFYLEDKDFIDAVHGARQPKVGIELGLLVQEILDACYRSMAAGQSVSLPAGEDE